MVACPTEMFWVCPCWALNKLSSSNILCPWWCIHDLCAGQFFVMSVGHKLKSLERREPQLRKCKSARHSSNDCWQRAQPIVGDVTPGLIVLGFVTKQPAQAMKNKPVSSTPPWPLHPIWVPGLTYFDDVQCCGRESQMNPFYSNLLLVMVFYCSNSHPNYRQFDIKH